jgi:serine/threonine protein kinase
MEAGNPQPPQIPDHELLCQIGHGAYGEVWLARNAVGALRAVKIVQRQSFQHANHFEREFKGLLKFEPLSRSHDGLVDVLQIGRRDDVGYFYYVMELADPAGPRVASNPCSVISKSATSKPEPSDFIGELVTDSLVTDYCPRTLRSELQMHGRLPPA